MRLAAVKYNGLVGEIVYVGVTRVDLVVELIGVR